MKRTPAYYRARLEAFEKVIKEEAGQDRDDKNNNSVVLRNGVLPSGIEKKINSLIRNNLRGKSNCELFFKEIARFNTWFEMYPEKVAGVECITSSREFPIMIKGKEQDIIRTLTSATRCSRTWNSQKVIPHH